MLKKISVLLVTVILISGFSACSIKNNKNTDPTMPAISLTAKETLVHNYFRDKIPEFDFDNTPIEKYKDGLSYVLTVECSEKEYKQYIKKLKKAGFEENVSEADSYYIATDAEGYLAEVSYVTGMLTVYVKKA